MGTWKLKSVPIELCTQDAFLSFHSHWQECSQKKLLVNQITEKSAELPTELKMNLHQLKVSAIYLAVLIIPAEFTE